MQIYLELKKKLIVLKVNSIKARRFWSAESKVKKEKTNFFTIKFESKTKFIKSFVVAKV